MIPIPALRCHDLERFLGEGEWRVHALRGVSLELGPATVHAVVGPSGCGKSTLLYISDCSTDLTPAGSSWNRRTFPSD